MRPISIRNLVLATMAATGLSVVALRLWVGSGGALPASPTNLVLTLYAVALVLVALSAPGWRYKRAVLDRAKNASQGRASGSEATEAAPPVSGLAANRAGLRPKRVDPFYAVRVLVLAKAVAVTGAIFLGWHLGLLLHIWFSATLAPAPSASGAWGALGALLMILAALLSEWIWRLPDDVDTVKGAAADGAVAPG